MKYWRNRWHACKKRQKSNQEGHNFWNVGGEGVGDDLLQVVKDEAALLHARHDGAEVVVQKNLKKKLSRDEIHNHQQKQNVIN